MKVFCACTLAFAVALIMPLEGATQSRKPRGKETASPPNAQQQRTPTPNDTATRRPDIGALEDFDRAKFDGGFSKTRWSLSIEHQNPSYPAKTSRDLAADLAMPEVMARYPLLVPYKDELGHLTIRLGVLGGTLTYFLYGGKDLSFPYRVVRFKNTKCFVAYLATDTVYNTIALPSSKRRAARAAASRGLPAILEIAKVLDKADIQTVATFVTYGTKDSLDKSVLATKAEVLGIVVSKAHALAFADGDLSDTELIRQALVLVSDRDATYDFVKVELQLE